MSNYHQLIEEPAFQIVPVEDSEIDSDADRGIVIWNSTTQWKGENTLLLQHSDRELHMAKHHKPQRIWACWNC